MIRVNRWMSSAAHVSFDRRGKWTPTIKGVVVEHAQPLIAAFVGVGAGSVVGDGRER